jgi:hypothetical protein
VARGCMGQRGWEYMSIRGRMETRLSCRLQINEKTSAHWSIEQSKQGICCSVQSNY